MSFKETGAALVSIGAEMREAKLTETGAGPTTLEAALTETDAELV